MENAQIAYTMYRTVRILHFISLEFSMDCKLKRYSRWSVFVLYSFGFRFRSTEFNIH